MGTRGCENGLGKISCFCFSPFFPISKEKRSSRGGTGGVAFVLWTGVSSLSPYKRGDAFKNRIKVNRISAHTRKKFSMVVFDSATKVLFFFLTTHPLGWHRLSNSWRDNPNDPAVNRVKGAAREAPPPPPRPPSTVVEEEDAVPPDDGWFPMFGFVLCESVENEAGIGRQKEDGVCTAQDVQLKYWIVVFFGGKE